MIPSVGWCCVVLHYRFCFRLTWVVAILLMLMGILIPAKLVTPWQRPEMCSFGTFISPASEWFQIITFGYSRGEYFVPSQVKLSQKA